MTSKFSWEEALREVYTHPHYKLIPSLTEKKALFVKYQEMQREVEREERHQQNIRSQEEFKELLRSTSDITPNTRYSEALEILKGRAAFEAVNNPKDRARIFDEFISEVRREEADRNRQKRRRMADKLQTLLESISEIRKETPWREACELIRKHATFREDEDLKEMDAMDLLTGYENYIKYLERKYQTKMSDERDEERRRERTNRQAFREMLKELEGKGTLTAATCWSEIYPVIQGRKEFQGILSQPGSTPLDLFWDYSHQLQEHYIQVVRPIIQELKEQFGDNVGWMGNLNEEIITATVTRHGLDQSVATALRSHLLQKKTLLSPEEERAHLRAKVEAYRKEHRKLLDRLKHSIKHLQPPILIDSNYEDYKGALARDVDIAQVEDEEVRRYYFDKYIRHLRKKAGLETAPSDDE